MQKKERIDKQYYIAEEELTKDITLEMFSDSESFLIKLKLAIKTLNSQSIETYRDKYAKLV